MPRRKAGTLLPLELQILAAALELQTETQPIYGFSLARTLAEANDGARLTAHGTLYKALARLTESGLLEASWEDAELGEAEGRPRRRLYSVTGAGELALDASRQTADAAASGNSKTAVTTVRPVTRTLLIASLTMLAGTWMFARSRTRIAGSIALALSTVLLGWWTATAMEVISAHVARAMFGALRLAGGAPHMVQAFLLLTPGLLIAAFFVTAGVHLHRLLPRRTAAPNEH